MPPLRPGRQPIAGGVAALLFAQSTVLPAWAAPPASRAAAPPRQDHPQDHILFHANSVYNHTYLKDDLELSSWLAFVTDGSCTVQQVRESLSEVREALGSRLHQPTIYTFLRRFLRRTGWTEESFSLANYLIELAVTDSSFLVYRPQVVAAAAAVLSRQYLACGIPVKQMAGWKVKLLRCADVNLYNELAPCISALSHLHAADQSQHNKFVNRKYSWARLHMVAKIPPNLPGSPDFFAAYLQE